MTMQQTLRYAMSFCPGAPHDREGTMVSLSKVVGAIDALEEAARPVVGNPNLISAVARSP
jgi:hypothetical protein